MKLKFIIAIAISAMTLGQFASASVESFTGEYILTNKLEESGLDCGNIVEIEVRDGKFVVKQAKDAGLWTIAFPSLDGNKSNIRGSVDSITSFKGTQSFEYNDGVVVIKKSGTHTKFGDIPVIGDIPVARENTTYFLKLSEDGSRLTLGTKNFVGPTVLVGDYDSSVCEFQREENQ